MTKRIKASILLLFLIASPALAAEPLPGPVNARLIAEARKPMMTSDLDIYRSARTLINQHGEDAPIHAAMRADELLKVGDMDGVGV